MTIDDVFTFNARPGTTSITGTWKSGAPVELSGEIEISGSKYTITGIEVLKKGYASIGDKISLNLKTKGWNQIEVGSTAITQRNSLEVMQYLCGQTT